MGMASSLVGINWFRVSGVIAIAVLMGLTGWGAYNYYFKKPTPIIQYIQPQQGGTVNITPPIQQKEKSRLFTGLYGGASKDSYEGGLILGVLW